MTACIMVISSRVKQYEKFLSMETMHHAVGYFFFFFCAYNYLRGTTGKHSFNYVHAGFIFI